MQTKPPLWTCVIDDSPIQLIPFEQCSDATLRSVFAVIQASHIRCPSNANNTNVDLQNSLNQLAASLSSLVSTTQQSIDVMANSQSADRRGDSKKSFVSKPPGSIQKIVLIASIIHSSMTPTRKWRPSSIYPACDSLLQVEPLHVKGYNEAGERGHFHLGEGSGG